MQEPTLEDEVKGVLRERKRKAVGIPAYENKHPKGGEKRKSYSSNSEKRGKRREKGEKKGYPIEKGGEVRKKCTLHEWKDSEEGMIY